MDKPPFLWRVLMRCILVFDLVLAGYLTGRAVSGAETMSRLWPIAVPTLLIAAHMAWRSIQREEAPDGR